MNWNDVKTLSKEQLIEFVRSAPNNYRDVSSFWGYHQVLEEGRRNVFLSLYSYLGYDFRGKSVIDVGLGTGESLDIAKEMGASHCAFADRDPIFCRWNQLKGYTMYRMDYLTANRNDIKERFDLVICKGAINTCSTRNLREMAMWLDGLGDVVVVTPTYNKGAGVDGHFYTCPPGYESNEFHKAFMEMGYGDHFIKGYSHELRFPHTYIKR